MARGGARPGAGRPRKGDAPAKVEAEAASAEPRVERTPLEYMLAVMNDPDADKARRDRMAQAAAPYVHGKPGDAPKGKKEEAKERAAAAHSKFAVPQPPRNAVN